MTGNRTDSMTDNMTDGMSAGRTNNISPRTYLCFDIGGTKIASAYVTLPQEGSTAGPKVEDVRTIATEASRGGPDILQRLAELARARMQEREVSAIGVGSAGVVSSSTGTIISSTDLIPNWTGQHVCEALTQSTNLRAYMVNDVVAHGLGEAAHGAGRGYARVLSVGVGTGIGGAIIVHGREITGAHGVAGHIGHLMHGLAKGIPCSCGATCGHIEPVASGTGIGTLYNLTKPESAAEVDSGKEVAELARAGDDFAARVLRESARALGETLGGAVNLTDPDVVVVSGSVTQAGEIWWDALRDGFAASAMNLTRDIPLLNGTLGGSAPLVGAAVAADLRFAG